MFLVIKTIFRSKNGLAFNSKIFKLCVLLKLPSMLLFPLSLGCEVQRQMDKLSGNELQPFDFDGMAFTFSFLAFFKSLMMYCPLQFGVFYLCFRIRKSADPFFICPLTLLLPTFLTLPFTNYSTHSNRLSCNKRTGSKISKF